MEDSKHIRVIVANYCEADLRPASTLSSIADDVGALGNWLQQVQAQREFFFVDTNSPFCATWALCSQSHPNPNAPVSALVALDSAATMLMMGHLLAKNVPVQPVLLLLVENIAELQREFHATGGQPQQKAMRDWKDIANACVLSLQLTATLIGIPTFVAQKSPDLESRIACLQNPELLKTIAGRMNPMTSVCILPSLNELTVGHVNPPTVSAAFNPGVAALLGAKS